MSAFLYIEKRNKIVLLFSKCLDFYINFSPNIECRAFFIYINANFKKIEKLRNVKCKEFCKKNLTRNFLLFTQYLDFCIFVFIKHARSISLIGFIVIFIYIYNLFLARRLYIYIHKKQKVPIFIR